jgi:hypothetical protein
LKGNDLSYAPQVGPPGDGKKDAATGAFIAKSPAI